MLSPKQLQIMAFRFSKYDALICDGAIRSGKTSFMTIAFVADAMERFQGQRFGICGKTVESAIKNIIHPYLGVKWDKNRYKVSWRKSEKTLIVTDGRKTNIFEVFGGKDESSFELIQGRTLAGVLLDEVALQPQSFVQQALARCSVDGSRFWFNCNPGSPEHWFYKEWVLQPAKHNAYHIHFLLDDNPSLSDKIKQRYETEYSGVFYRRYILGEWCVAEGLVYEFFGEDQITDEVPQAGEYYISCDYGTLNPFSAGLWCWDGKTATRIKEYYYSGRDERHQKTDEEYYQELEILAGNLPIVSVVVDPSAASFITTIRRHGKFKVRQAKNDVVPGILTTANLLRSGKMRIHRSCKDCIREFGLYRWDEKQTTDKPIKENDHAMDDTRYFAATALDKLANQSVYKPLWVM